MIPLEMSSGPVRLLPHTRTVSVIRSVTLNHDYCTHKNLI